MEEERGGMPGQDKKILALLRLKRYLRLYSSQVENFVMESNKNTKRAKKELKSRKRVKKAI